MTMKVQLYAAGPVEKPLRTPGKTIAPEPGLPSLIETKL